MTQQPLNSAPVYAIQMVREREVLYAAQRLTAPQQAVAAFNALVGNPDRENFAVIMLDAKNKIVGLHVVSQGSLNQTIVHPRETFKAAILANAATVILAHNHPSGDTKPSREDMEITKRLREAGDILGIKVLDHVIVDTDSGSYTSFVEGGLL